MDRYDSSRILRGLQAMVAGRGTVVTHAAPAPGRLDAILIPQDHSASPVVVRVYEDVCRLRFGSGSTDSLGYGGPDDEDLVLDSVQAIISGNAWERFVLDGEGIHVLPRIVGELHQSFAGEEDLDVAYERRIPAWPRNS